MQNIQHKHWFWLFIFFKLLEAFVMVKIQMGFGTERNMNMWKIYQFYISDVSFGHLAHFIMHHDNVNAAVVFDSYLKENVFKWFSR